MIRIYHLLLALTPVFVTIHLPAQQDSAIPVKGYKLFWQDEFDETTLNKKKWDYRGLDRKGDAYNRTEAVNLDGKGHLIITAKFKEDSVITGMIATEYIFQTQYGYFECRALLPETPGIFPAFWLQSTINGDRGTPERNGVELDIFEYFPHERKNEVAHTMHWGGYGATHRVAGPVWAELKPTADKFHTFGLEWTPSGYTTYVDGIKTFSGTENISHVPEFIVLSLGYNKLAAGPTIRRALPDSFVVDYVRVYKKIQ